MWNIMNNIIIAGIVQPEINSGIVHLQDYVYDCNGIAPTCTARDWKSPREILILIGDHEWVIQKQ
jgi:hypothetical protein